MMWWLTWSSVAASLLIVDADVDFRLHDDDGFSVHVRGVQVIEHTPSRPFLYVGSGSTEITGLHGNFRVDDEVIQRMPVTDLQVTKDAGGDITMTTKTPTPVTVRLGERSGLLAVSLRVDGLGGAWDRVWVRLSAHPGEHVYGAGEQYSSLDLRGAAYPIWVREQGVGRNASSALTALMQVLGGAGGDYHTTYFPQPSFVSSRRYFALSTGSEYTVLDFTHAQYHELQFVSTQQVELLLGGGDTLVEVLEGLSAVVGRQPPLPEWLGTGTVIGLQGGTARMLEILDRVEAAGVPVAGLWIQDWSGSIHREFGKRVYWNWEWNQKHYPDLPEVATRLRASGVRLLGYITPHLIDDGTLFQYAQLHGYLLRTSSNDTLLIDFMQFQCGSVDLTNPAAKLWYKGIIKSNLIELGFGGWMADFSEYLPTEAVFADGSPGVAMHNRYAALWAQTNREAVEEAGVLGDVMFFMRAGFTGSQQYSTLWWAGDQNVDWSRSDGLASTVPAALSLGLSGAGLTHYDIGGYTTFSLEAPLGDVTARLHMVRTRELFFRGAEVAVFTPVMRTHEGNRPDLNFQVYDDATDLKQFAVLVNMFRTLSPYTKAAMVENSERGLPLQRPLFLHYEDADENSPLWTLSYQYLYGRDLLVAPVIDPGVQEWKVYLPLDRWRYLYDGTVYEGPQWVVVPAPLGRPPVFYREQTQWETIFKDMARIANTGTEAQHCVSNDGCLP